MTIANKPARKKWIIAGSICAIIAVAVFVTVMLMPLSTATDDWWGLGDLSPDSQAILVKQRSEVVPLTEEQQKQWLTALSGQSLKENTYRRLAFDVRTAFFTDVTVEITHHKTNSVTVLYLDTDSGKGYVADTMNYTTRYCDFPVKEEVLALCEALA